MLRSHKFAVLLALLLATLIGSMLWRSGPLGATTFPDGTEIVFERYTSGTLHEFGRRDLRKVYKWVPAGFWTAIRYKARFYATVSEPEPCTILWVRVRWKPERQEPIPSDLHVQVVEQDGTAYPWHLARVYQPASTEFVLPYRAESLPPKGGNLKVRFVEKLEQRAAQAGHMPKDYVARNASLQPARKQKSGSLLLPNPSRAKPEVAAALPLPQVQERDGLRATLHAIRVKPRPDGEFIVEPQVELRWHGAKLENAFRHYWSISTPGGPRTEPRFRLWTFIDHMPDSPPQPHMLPTAPMRGHREWTLHLHVVSTAAFPELEKERGLPMFTAPVAAQEKTAPNPPKPILSQEAADAGIGIADAWPPRFLRLVVHRTPERWYPVEWKSNDPLPFVVVAEAEGKRVVLRSSGAGPGYGHYGLARYDFGTSDVARRLAYGEERASGIERTPPSERTALPETVEYRLIPRRYWSFAFVVAPAEPPPVGD